MRNLYIRFWGKRATAKPLPHQKKKNLDITVLKAGLQRLSKPSVQGLWGSCSALKRTRNLMIFMCVNALLSGQHCAFYPSTPSKLINQVPQISRKLNFQLRGNSIAHPNDCKWTLFYWGAYNYRTVFVNVLPNWWLGNGHCESAAWRLKTLCFQWDFAWLANYGSI